MDEAEPRTIWEAFRRVVSTRPDESALGFIEDGRLAWHSWLDLSRLVDRRAAQLAALGVAADSRVAQIGENSVDWIVNDLSLHGLRAVHVPIHASLPSRQSFELVEHCGAKWRIAGSDEPPSSMTAAAGVVTIRSSDLSEFAESESRCSSTPGEHAPTVEERPQPDPDSLATVLYTSGSLGEPRGVMLTHRNLIANATAAVQAVSGDENEVRLCFLPLSHVYARTCDLYCWIVRGTRLVLVESRDTIIRDCQIVRPTAINGVPYFYQRIADRIRSSTAGGAEETPQKILGGQVKRCFSGGAGAPPEVEALFERCGLPILSGYGLTEAAPVVTATANDNYEAGAVGRPLKNLRVELAEDGEILVCGPSVMAGYLNDPAATAEVLREGSLHTGDLGAWTASGNLRIVGRKKETIVLATGRNVAPAPIEMLLLGSPLIEQICVVGDDRPHLAALIVPNPEALRREIRSRRLWVWSRRRALAHRGVVKLYRQELAQRLADRANHEQITAFVLLDRGFSLESGELTPKLSLRRNMIQQRFAVEIERIYGRSSRAVSTP